MCYSKCWKFCSECGIFARADNLKLQHFYYCQPQLQRGQSGFLMNDQLPESNHEDFHMLLKILGVTTPPQDNNRK